MRRCTRLARPARCTRVHVVARGEAYIEPVTKECTAFAPATVANLGPGFDWMGCAVAVSCKMTSRNLPWASMASHS